VRQLHVGPEWDVYEVRYVRKHDGVFVRGLKRRTTTTSCPARRRAKDVP
jgi:hypothetical protein